MRGRLRLGFVGRAAVSVAVLAVLLYVLPWHELTETARNLPPGVWATVLLGFLAGHFMGAEKWRMMLGAGRASLSRRDGIRCYSAGLFANLWLPSIVGGDVLRAALAAKSAGRVEAVVLSSAADRMVDIAALALLITAGGVLAGSAVVGWRTPVLVVTAVGGAGVAGLALVARRPLSAWPRSWRRRIGRVLVALRRLGRSGPTALVAFAIALSMQTGFALLNAWIGHSVGIDVSVTVWLLVWPLAKLAGLLPVSLGGLGVRDAALAGLLAPFGVAAAAALVVSLAWDAVLLVGGLLAGLTWRILSRGSDPRTDPSHAGHSEGNPASVAAP